MLYILITASVLCSSAPIKTQYIQTNRATFENDVQLIRRGWFNPETNGRCKTVKITYTVASAVTKL